MYSLKFAHLVKEKLPGAECHEYYIDMRAYGKGYEEFLERIKEEGIHVVRGRSAEVVSRDGRLYVRGEDVLAGKLVENPVDMVLLAVGLQPSEGTDALAKMLGIGRVEDGWFDEANYNTDPSSTERGGIFVAGVCQGPKDIPDTVAQASAAAGRVLRAIVSGRTPGSRAELGLADIERQARGADAALTGTEGRTMAVRANPRLVDDLQRYGAEDVSKCLSLRQLHRRVPAERVSPSCSRARSMRALQMGLEQRLRSSLDPVALLLLRRLLRAVPARRRSRRDDDEHPPLAHRAVRLHRDLEAVLPLARDPGRGDARHRGRSPASASSPTRRSGAGASRSTTAPQAFLPESAVHVFDWAMGGALFALLLVNCARMWWFTMRGDGGRRASSAHRVPAPSRPAARCTSSRSKRYRQCKNTGPWGVHLALMLSYVTMLVLIVFFLPEMQHGPDVRWGVHVFGYLAAIGLLAGTILALRGRLTRQAAHHKHSHASDWIFLGMLLALAVTGIVQHVLHRAGLPMAANVAYLVHLMVVAPFEITQVPFGKWSHMAYRPLAIYFAAVQAAAQAATAQVVEQPATSVRA